MCANATSIRQKHTDKPSLSWIGDWWEVWGFACLASDLHTLIQSHSDLLRFALPFQIHSVSLRFIQSHSDSSLTQICSVSCKLTQIYSASCSFTRIRSDSQHFTQSHSDSLSFAQIHSDTLSCTRIHSDSHKLRFSLPPSD